MKALQEVGKMDDNSKIGVYSSIGYLYENWGIHKKAIDYFKKVYVIKKNEGDIAGQINILKLIGVSYLNTKNYNQALGNYSFLVELNKKQNNTNGVISSLRKIADTYISLNNYDKALDFNLEILKLKNEQKDSVGISNYLNQIGFIYKHLNKYRQALKYFKKALNLNRKLGKEERSNSLILINIGVMNQYLKDINSALASFNEVLKIEKSQNDNLEIARINTYIVAIYLSLADYDNAKDYALEAIKYAEISDSKEFLEKNYKRLSLIYENSGSSKKALVYYKKYAEVKDQLIAAEKRKQQALLVNQVEAEKKEKELKLLLVDQEVKNLELQKFQIVAEKKEQDLKLFQQNKALTERNRELQVSELKSQQLEKERSLLEKTRAVQQLILNKQKLEAKSRNQQIASLQKDQEIADLALKQKELVEKQQAEALKLAEREKELQTLRIEEEENKNIYYLVGIGASVVILILIITSLIGIRKANGKLAHQNHEIQHQKKEIEGQRDEITGQKDEVERAYQNIQILSEFGQKITSTLDVETINRLVYDYVITLMDVSSFGIGLVNNKDEVIEFKGFIDEGQPIPYQYDLLSEDNSLSVWCVKNQEPIVMNDFLTNVIDYISEETNYLTKKTPASVIYQPLIKENRAIGVITVQSRKKGVYSQKNLTILQTLASYIIIALDNAYAYEVIKEKNKHITDSIRYAQTIQEAILPSTKKIEENIPEHFILFRPKDIVSGDYYWYSHIPPEKLNEEGYSSNGKTFIAAIDCTGHGVSGAFMSIIGNTILNEIVNQRGIYDPAEIIERLNTGIIEALRQEEKANDDGMDICLCLIEDYPTGEVKVTFSGAKRPLYYIVEGQPLLRELKGTNKTIGGLQRKEKSFSNQEVIIPKGSMVYLSTDGWVDQNNLNKKKLGTVKFKKLLQNNAHLQLKSQRQALETALDIHKRDVEQRDDITILGIKV